MKLLLVLFIFCGITNAASAVDSIECYRLVLRLSDYENHMVGYGKQSRRAVLICDDEDSYNQTEISWFDIEMKYAASLAFTERNELNISFKQFNGRSLYDVAGIYVGIRQAGSVFFGFERLDMTNGRMIIRSTSAVIGFEASSPAPVVFQLSLVNPAMENLLIKKAKSKYVIPEPW